MDADARKLVLDALNRADRELVRAYADTTTEDPDPDEYRTHAVLAALAGQLTTAPTSEAGQASEWAERMRSLLGKQVRVTLQQEPNEHIVTGRLLSFTEDGEVSLRDETGTIHWGWPNLRTEPTDRPDLVDSTRTASEEQSTPPLSRGES